MTKNRLVIINFALLYICTYTTSFLPKCCHDTGDYAYLLSNFSCGLYCDLIQRPFKSSCISCLSDTSEATSYNSDILGFRNLTKPVIACQDVFHKLKNGESKTWGQVVLLWSAPNVSKSPAFSIEARTEEILEWYFIGMTNSTAVLVDNVDFYARLQFRVIPFVLPNLKLLYFTSDWIYLAGSTLTKEMKSLNLSVAYFRLNRNSLEAVIEWFTPKESPCSLILHWRPTDQYMPFKQRILNVLMDSSPIFLSDLLFETKYLVTLTPVYQSDVLRVKSVETWFVTPSCLTLTKENFTLCAPGPPLNVTVMWTNDTEASISWLPPNFSSSENEVTGYHLSVRETSKKHDTVLHYKENFAVEKNVLKVTVTDLKPSVLYIFEVRATSNGGVGPPVAVDLDIKKPVEMTQTPQEIPWHYIVPSSLFAVSALIVALCINFLRLRKGSKLVSYPSGSADVPEHLLPHLIPQKKIDLYDEIGKGEFGVVYRGVYCHNKNKEVVAVKVFPSESVSRDKLLHEVEVLHIIGRHRNIVSLVGFTLSFDKMCLVLEYCILGNLHSRICKLKKELSVIKKKLSDPKQPLMETYKDKDENYGLIVSSYINQIAVGMEYISSLNLIHRDLAARNILLYDEKHVKIADFGLARDVSEDSTYTVLQQKRLPIRWMAPESLEKQTFSTYSDVWSFGVLIWEIFKFGKVPYSTLNNSAILNYLKNGYRLPKPPASSQLWYDLMLECWHFNPLKRPTFKELVVKTENILGKLSNYTTVIDS